MEGIDLVASLLMSEGGERCGGGGGGSDGVAPTIKQPPKKTLNLWCLQIFAIVH